MAGCRAMMIMADMMGDTAAKEEYRNIFDQVYANYETLWRDTENVNGIRLQYYITCYDPETGEVNEDVWINQLDAIWAMISMGEEPFIPEDRIKMILRTVYENNRTAMGWCMTRTKDGEAVESEQGQDVYTTSNYVFAQLLDYYGMEKESKEVYEKMDDVVFRYGNSLITPDNLRAEYEMEEGEDKAGPHYIVAAYPRPGAVFTHIVMQHIKKLQEQKKAKKIEAEELIAFAKDLMK
jgi:uncharacterized protein (DUF608 family)